MFSDPINDRVKNVEFHKFNGTGTVVCALVLDTGFVVVGQAHCLDPDKFDPQLGMSLSRDDANRKVSELLGYEHKLNALKGAQQ